MTSATLIQREDRLRRLSEQTAIARDIRDNAIRIARNQGMGVREIARLLDIDPAQVTRICQRKAS